MNRHFDKQVPSPAFHLQWPYTNQASEFAQVLSEKASSISCCRGSLTNKSWLPQR